MEGRNTGHYETGVESGHTVRIPELVDALVQYIQPVAMEKNLHFRYRTERMTSYLLYGNREVLFRILSILLDNAVEYTPTGGDVILCARELLRNGENQTLEFYVQDTGIGFSPNRPDALFSRTGEPDEDRVLAVGHESAERIEPLSEAARLAESLGGTLSCESGRGFGAVVRLIITLPAGEAAESVSYADKTKDLYSFFGKRVLLAEDHPLNLEIAKMMLERVGFDVETAVNGREAVDLFAREDGRFDLVLMDIRMPLMDGIEAVRVIRSMDVPGAEKIPVIALTASAYEEDARRGRDAGMDEALLKPIDPDKMYKTLTKYLF